MKARSVSGISLAPFNQWGGHYFMSLVSGKKIHGYKWIELPMGEDVITRVHKLAINEEQPEFVDGMVSFKWDTQTINTQSSSENIENDGENVCEENVILPMIGAVNSENNEINEREINDDVSINDMLDEQNNNDDETNIFNFDNKDVEEELINEMNMQNETQDSEVLNDAHLDEQEDFFESCLNFSGEEDKYNMLLEQQQKEINSLIPNVAHAGEELLSVPENNIDVYSPTNETPQGLPTSDTSTPTNNEVESDSAVPTSRPRRTNAGQGVMTLEPSWGGKEHLQY